ncbi:SRPBCC family protein [Streptomyces sp. 4N509B]|uniref:SRPBCC family protein n=1 Tax=Streptomyces sp. 4N509B TaxID=3457413 RepID=UPI003FD2F51B
MAVFLVEQESALPAAEAWRRLTDWRRHSAHAPLTRLSVRPPGPTGLGTVVVARTGMGRLGFDDPMEVVAWSPPPDDGGGGVGFCRMEKRGRVITGWAEIEVHPGRGPGSGEGSRVLWREEAHLRGTPRLLDAPATWCARQAFTRLVRALLR